MVRTSLMTLMGVAPLAFRMTSKVVFSSAGAAVAAPVARVAVHRVVAPSGPVDSAKDALGY